MPLVWSWELCCQRQQLVTESRKANWSQVRGQTNRTVSSENSNVARIGHTGGRFQSQAQARKDGNVLLGDSTVLLRDFSTHVGNKLTKKLRRRTTGRNEEGVFYSRTSVLVVNLCWKLRPLMTLPNTRTPKINDQLCSCMIRSAATRLGQATAGVAALSRGMSHSVL